MVNIGIDGVAYNKLDCYMKKNDIEIYSRAIDQLIAFSKSGRGINNIKLLNDLQYYKTKCANLEAGAYKGQGAIDKLNEELKDMDENTDKLIADNNKHAIKIGDLEYRLHEANNKVKALSRDKTEMGLRNINQADTIGRLQEENDELKEWLQMYNDKLGDIKDIIGWFHDKK